VSGPLRAEHEELLVHTGQHYDDSLSNVFFSELGLPAPERELGIGGGSNTSQTARMLAALEPLLVESEPDAVLVYGDTNSTLAGALVAAQRHVPVVHIEAGMRSHDRAMPEELNRVLVDHMSDLLLCSSELAAENLREESARGTIEVVGDVMIDVAQQWQSSATASSVVLAAYDLTPGEYLLLTAHRAGNVDNPERLRLLADIVASIQERVVFPLHPRTRARLREAGLLEHLRAQENLTLTEPLGYVEFGTLLCGARAVLTDSGGVQKEAYLARVPCVTLRSTTEWMETVQAGWNTLADLGDGEGVLSALEQPIPKTHPELYGDGKAAERCVAAIGKL
jgi:UDP-N-acetylglucosamine 2-epimerase (non-hydrolysing)/UDP-GlcNAc3NAcA epimerase